MVVSKKVDIMEFVLYFFICVIYLLIGFFEDCFEEIEQYVVWVLVILVGFQVDLEKVVVVCGVVMEVVQVFYDVVKVVVV